MDKTAELIVDAIVTDLTDRRGLRQEWEQIDEETQNEIKGEWMRLVREILDSPNKVSFNQKGVNDENTEERK